MATVASPTPSTTAMAATVRREPMRAMTGPDNGRARTEPAAMVTSSRPSSDGSSCSRSRTCGMREAQLAKAKPEPVKAM